LSGSKLANCNGWKKYLYILSETILLKEEECCFAQLLMLVLMKSTCAFFAMEAFRSNILFFAQDYPERNGL